MFGFIKRLFRKKKPHYYFIEFENDNRIVKIEVPNKQDLFKTLYIEDYTIKIVDLTDTWYKDKVVTNYKAIDYTF